MMIDQKKHCPGHQQALIKDNICIAALVFEYHDINKITEVCNNFEYDYIIDCCEHDIFPILGAIWNGEFFDQKPAESWIARDDLKWHPPVPRPGDNYWWNEEEKIWVEILSISGEDNGNF